MLIIIFMTQLFMKLQTRGYHVKQDQNENHSGACYHLKKLTALTLL